MKSKQETIQDLALYMSEECRISGPNCSECPLAEFDEDVIYKCQYLNTAESMYDSGYRKLEKKDKLIPVEQVRQRIKDLKSNAHRIFIRRIYRRFKLELEKLCKSLLRENEVYQALGVDRSLELFCNFCREELKNDKQGKASKSGQEEVD